MTNIPFSQLSLTPKVERAIAEMGFDLATPIQSEAIPLIRTGIDVIARSQTGTGKTIAYAIPAIERVDTHEEKDTVQVLILCPTRELAQQATEEIRKVARFKTGIRPVEIYGGTAIDRQCIRLRRANIVIGTPGRIMDHMRRKTLKLSHVKMVVLDEADEMLNMGFKEDIETILKDIPEDRQTVLFSATMPPAILKLTQEFQRDPRLIEINKDQVTIEDIEQRYIDVPHNRKKDALLALLQFHEPKRAIIFCNTKKMVDELTELLLSHHFSAESIHSDIKQFQRTSVMQDFKQGRTAILIATDIAARGIDVSDVDFVINFDLPANSEYYVHRIGRTGRAGKSGCSITLCSGRREISAMRNIALDAKSDIARVELPTSDEMKKLNSAKLLFMMEEALKGKPQPVYSELADRLVERGYSMGSIAAAAMQICFENNAPPAQVPAPTPYVPEPTPKVKRDAGGVRLKPARYELILINIGSNHHVAVNHIIGAVTERTGLSSKDIGKVEIFPDQSVVEIPAGHSDEVVEAMLGCKITGRPVKTEKLTETK
ncbi:DEAD-box ATP-dependent RNA helicase CshA [bioreactor metagenome]|uniref:DEAD-box ATP-dependent RNA helicase CshA n=1 Tax=bioreactor metagenome TaxID=1076179 RepID=A0A644VY82_9ZZZZ